MLTIAVCLVLLTSCSKTDLQPKSNIDQGITYDNVNTDGINGVYIITEKGPVPIAYSNNGKVNLMGDVYYYNLKNILQNDEGIKQKTFTYFDEIGCNIRGKTYSEFSQDKEKPYKNLVLTGNWRLCPDLRYIKYSPNDNVPSQYTEFLKQSFSDKLDQEIKISEVWETDLDADGTNEAIFKAKGDNYTIIAVMSDTVGNKVISANFNNTQKFDSTVFFADLDGNGKPSILLLSGASLKTVTVFKEETATISYCVYLPIV